MASKPNTNQIYHFYVFELREEGKDVKEAAGKLKQQMRNVYNMTTVSPRDCIGEDYIDGKFFYVFRKQRHSTEESMARTLRGLEKTKVKYEYSKA